MSVEEEYKEKYGVDLVTKRCFVKNKKYRIVPARVIGIYFKGVPSLILETLDEDEEKFVVTKLKDYGKVYALTKEELVHGKSKS